LRTCKINSGRTIDAWHVADNLRKEDSEEVYLTFGSDPRYYVKQCWILTPEDLRWIFYVDNEPAAIFGCAPRSMLKIDQAVPWFLGSPLMEKAKWSFVKATPKYINIMLDHYEYLENFVWAEYKASIMWMKWAGFTEGKTGKFGPFDAPFTRFYTHRDIYPRRK